MFNEWLKSFSLLLSWLRYNIISIIYKKNNNRHKLSLLLLFFFATFLISKHVALISQLLKHCGSLKWNWLALGLGLCSPPCQFTVTVSSLQFSVWQFSTSSTRAAQQHFEQMVQQFLLMPQYFCLSSAEDTTKWKRIYTQSVAGHRILDSTADSTPAYSVQRRTNAAGVHQKTWHGTSHFVCFSIPTLQLSLQLLFLHSPPSLFPLFLALLSCFLFLGCVQTYFFPYSSALWVKYYVTAKQKLLLHFRPWQEMEEKQKKCERGNIKNEAEPEEGGGETENLVKCISIVFCLCIFKMLGACS